LPSMASRIAANTADTINRQSGYAARLNMTDFLSIPTQVSVGPTNWTGRRYRACTEANVAKLRLAGVFLGETVLTSANCDH